MLASISTSVPDSSPTETICGTIGGKTSAFASGAGERLALTDRLLDVAHGLLDLPVVRRLPDDRERLDDRHARVEHHRQVAAEPRDRDLGRELAEDRHLELDRVDDAPHLLGVLVRAPPDHDDDRRRSRSAAAPTTCCARWLTRICVGSGSAEPRPANMLSKTGTTNVTITSTPMIAMIEHDDRVGHRGADLVLQLRFALVVLGDRCERGAEEAAGLADPHDAEHQRREGLRMPRQRRRERRARSRHRPAPATSAGCSFLSSVCSMRIESVRMSGRPALIRPAICRAKTASVLRRDVLGRARQLDLAVEAGLRLERHLERA